MLDLQEFIDDSGRNRFGEWFSELEVSVQVRLSTFLTRLRNGNTGSLKALGTGLLELRMDFGPGYRVYCGRDGMALVILLAGGTKQKQQADIREARELWQRYKDRKRAAKRTT